METPPQSNSEEPIARTSKRRGNLVAVACEACRRKKVKVWLNPLRLSVISMMLIDRSAMGNAHVRLVVLTQSNAGTPQAKARRIRRRQREDTMRSKYRVTHSLVFFKTSCPKMIATRSLL